MVSDVLPNCVKSDSDFTSIVSKMYVVILPIYCSPNNLSGMILLCLRIKF